jgi:hypothetical protein
LTFSKTYTIEWFEALHAASGFYPDLPEHVALEKEVDEMVADDWVWINHWSQRTNYIDFKLELGDDLGIWLETVEEKHEFKAL